MFTPVATTAKTIAISTTKLITKDLTVAFYNKVVHNATLTANVENLKPFIVKLKRDTFLQRFVDPTHVQSYQALTTTHPRGTSLTTNRYSGKFFDLSGSCGTYFGIAPVQTREVTTHLMPTVGAFGIDAELSHYTTVPDSKTNVSNLDYGIKVHGDRRMANGKINPVLGAGGKYVVQYRVKKPIRLLNLDFDNPVFLSVLDWIGMDVTIAPHLPRGMSLSKLFLTEEAQTDRLLHQSLAAALYEVRHLIGIDGVVARSARGEKSNNTTQASVICIWSGDGAILDSLEAYSVSYFDFAPRLPRLIGTKVNDSTDFTALRQDAKTANKE